jgi:hypothetical protein
MSVSTKVASTIIGCPGRGALVGVVGLRDSARRQDSHNERVLVLGMPDSEVLIFIQVSSFRVRLPVRAAPGPGVLPVTESRASSDNRRVAAPGRPSESVTVPCGSGPAAD